MARVTHPAQIDLCFGGLAREFLDFGAGVGPGDFARERFHLLGELDRNTPAGSSRGEMRFALRERGPVRFSGRCWPARWRGLP